MQFQFAWFFYSHKSFQDIYCFYKDFYSKTSERALYLNDYTFIIRS